MAYLSKSGIATANIWFPDSSKNLLEILQSNQDIKRVIFFAQWEWEFYSNLEFNQILDIAKSKHIPVEVVTGAAKIFNSRPRIDDYTLYHFPETFIFRSAHQLSLLGNDCSIDDIELLDYKFHFLSLNRLAHQHRMEMLDMLSLHDLVDSNAISWHNIRPYPYNYKFWTPKELSLTDKFTTEWNTYTIPEEYYTSFAQLVIESTTEAIFITEKTTLPIQAGKPFLVATCAGYHAYLEQLGFKLYTEIFDYSFDNEPNQTMRFSMIADNFRKLSTIPLSELNKLALSVKDKVLYNKKIIRNMVLDHNLYPKPIQDIIDIYETTGEEVDSYTISDYYSGKKIPTKYFCL